MAKRLPKKPDTKQLIVDAFAEMARDKSIDRETLQAIITETLSSVVRKKYGQEANFDIVVNLAKGDVEIYLIRTIVETVSDPSLEISLEEANAGEENYEVGDDFVEPITLENIAENFGRRMINMAGQTLTQRIRDVEKDLLVEQFSSRIGEVILGEIHQTQRSDIFVMHNGTELRLPRQEQIPGEKYRKNDTIRAIIKEVRRSGGSGSMPDIIISRSANEFLAKLFEIEIPEVYDGLIEIKGIARDPGERAKVAVYSADPRVDAVGACVGMKGIRIHSIVRELSNESIDVVNYSEDSSEFIRRALAPAKVKEINVFPDTRSATVIVPDEQVSLAIGRNGQNIRLASKLTGFSISLIKEGIEDIELIEFRDELGRDLYSELIDAEIDTAREFLEMDIDRLIEIGMSPRQILEVRNIMLTEFDERESEEVRERIIALENEISSAERTNSLEESDGNSEESSNQDSNNQSNINVAENSTHESSTQLDESTDTETI